MGFCLEKPFCIKNEKGCVNDGEVDTVELPTPHRKEGLSLYITDQERGVLPLL